MISPASHLVPHLKMIFIPHDCSFAQLRREIGIAFRLPSSDFGVKVYLDNNKPSKQIIDAGTMNLLSSNAKLAIEFDPDKSVFRYNFISIFMIFQAVVDSKSPERKRGAQTRC